jgi:hypothetical protein
MHLSAQAANRAPEFQLLARQWDSTTPARGQSIFARIFVRFVSALHESRRQQAVRQLGQYRHLNHSID